METAAGARYGADQHAMKGSPVLIRYADDFVVHCHTRQEALEVKATARRVADAERSGLQRRQDASRRRSTRAIDFLGFNVCRYHGKLLIKPSRRPSDGSGKGSAPSCAPCAGATPGRCSNGSTRSFAAGPPTTGHRYPPRSSASWTTTCGGSPSGGPRSATRTSRRAGCSPGTSARSTRPGNDRWVFGDRTSGAYLHRFAWTDIVRHQIVRHRASPDDPELAEYWAWRRRKAPLPINRRAFRLHQEQDGCCAICRATLVPVENRPQTPQQWETWLATTRKTIDIVWDPSTPDKAGPPRLIHLHCQPTRQPTGLA